MSDRENPSLAEVMTLAWLDECQCAHYPLEEFFLNAGATISPEVLEVCRRCPARLHELVWAYAQGTIHGYFGGLSPAQRRNMSLEEALEFAREDTLAAESAAESVAA